MSGDMSNTIVNTILIKPASDESGDKQRDSCQENKEKEVRAWEKRYAAKRLNMHLQQEGMALDNSFRLNTLPVAHREKERKDSVADEGNKTGHVNCLQAMYSIKQSHASFDEDLISTISKGRMHKRTDPGENAMNDMSNMQFSSAEGKMPKAPSPSDAAVTASAQDDVHDYATLCDDLAGMAVNDGVFELIFPSGQTMGVAITSQQSRTNFLLTPSSSALASWLQQQKVELADHLETRIRKTVSITVL